MYRDIIDDPPRFRDWLDRAFRDRPELFPPAFARGYRLEDSRTSSKLGVRQRRVRCRSGDSFSVRPCFVLPCMAGDADDARDPLFLRTFGVPSRALARAFGRGAMYRYRLEVAL